MCTELNTVFFCGTAVGKLTVITKASGRLVFPNTFGGQKEKDQKKKFHPTEAIARIKEVSDFIENCEIEIRQVAGSEQASDRCVLCANNTRYQVDNTDNRTNFFYI